MRFDLPFLHIGVDYQAAETSSRGPAPRRRGRMHYRPSDANQTHQCTKVTAGERLVDGTEIWERVVNQANTGCTSALEPAAAKTLEPRVQAPDAIRTSSPFARMPYLQPTKCAKLPMPLLAAFLRIFVSSLACPSSHPATTLSASCCIRPLIGYLNADRGHLSHCCADLRCGVDLSAPTNHRQALVQSKNKDIRPLGTG